MFIMNYTSGVLSLSSASSYVDCDESVVTWSLTCWEVVVAVSVGRDLHGRVVWASHSC